MDNPAFRYDWVEMSRNVTIHLFFLYVLRFVSLRTNGGEIVCISIELARCTGIAMIGYGGAALISLVLSFMCGRREEDDDDNDDDPFPRQEPPSGGIFLTYRGKCLNNANYLMLNA